MYLSYMVIKMFDDLGLRHLVEDANGFNTQFIISTVRDKLCENDQVSWFNNLWNDTNKPNGNKLRTYRTFKSEIKCEPYLYLNLNVWQRRTLSKLRIGVLPLEIETGRHCRPSIPLENRICTLCDLNVCESEYHFMLECPLYSDQRVLLFEHASSFEPQFGELSVTDQFVFLMSKPQLQGCLSKTVTSMFCRRQIFKTKS